MSERRMTDTAVGPIAGAIRIQAAPTPNRGSAQQFRILATQNRDETKWNT